MVVVVVQKVIIVSVLVRMGCQVIQFTSVETFPQGGGSTQFHQVTKQHWDKTGTRYGWGRAKEGRKGWLAGWKIREW